MNNLVPTEFYLFQNYPNPFTEKTSIKYCMAYKTRVRITIYNSEGEMIKKLVDEVKEPGTYEVAFYPASGIRHQASGTQHRISGIWHPVSGIQHRVSSIEHQVSGNRHPVSIPLFYQMKAGSYLSEKEMTLIQEENKSVHSK